MPHTVFLKRIIYAEQRKTNLAGSKENMIAGLGMDIVKTERIAHLVEKYGRDFLIKVFAEDELVSFGEKLPPSEKLAGRWAAKEAVAKALGCGFGKDCAMQDIHISNTSSGAPAVFLTGNAAKKALQIDARNIFLTISHEKDFACACAVLEK